LQFITEHVLADCSQVSVAAAINDQRFVTTAEQMAKEFVAPVEARSVSAQKPFHPGDEVGPRGFDDEMKMIGHQTQGVHLPKGFGAGQAQGFKEKMPVIVVQENRFSTIASIHRVVDRSGIFDS
jgi:hypothetical protein